jgi:hypothetical protein
MRVRFKGGIGSLIGGWSVIFSWGVCVFGGEISQY